MYKVSPFFRNIFFFLVLFGKWLLPCQGSIYRQHYALLDEERNRLNYFEFLIQRTSVSEAWEALPNKNKYLISQGLSHDTLFDSAMACKVKLHIDLLRFDVKDVVICLFKDEWESDEVVGKLQVEINGEILDAKGFHEKIKPVTGYVLFKEASLVTGYIIDTHFYGQVRLLDKFRNHFIVYYLEPFSLAPLYDNKLTEQGIKDKAAGSNAQANAILFEYVAHTEISSRSPYRTKLPYNIHFTTPTFDDTTSSASVNTPPTPFDDEEPSSTTLKAGAGGFGFYSTTRGPYFHSSTAAPGSRSGGRSTTVSATLGPHLRSSTMKPSHPRSTTLDPAMKLFHMTTLKDNFLRTTVTPKPDAGMGFMGAQPVSTTIRNSLIKSSTVQPHSSTTTPSTPSTSTTTIPTTFKSTTVTPGPSTESTSTTLLEEDPDDQDDTNEEESEEQVPENNAPIGYLVYDIPENQLQQPNPSPFQQLPDTDQMLVGYIPYDVQTNDYQTNEDDENDFDDEDDANNARNDEANDLSSRADPVQDDLVVIIGNDAAQDNLGPIVGNSAAQGNLGPNVGYPAAAHDNLGPIVGSNRAAQDNNLGANTVGNDGGATLGNGGLNGDSIRLDNSIINNIPINLNIIQIPPKNVSKPEVNVRKRRHSAYLRRLQNQSKSITVKRRPLVRPSQKRNKEGARKKFHKFRRRKRDVAKKPLAHVYVSRNSDLDDDDIIEEIFYPKGRMNKGSVDVFDYMREDALLCKLCIWIQPEFANKFGFMNGEKYGAAEVIDIVRYLNWVFRPMDFSMDHKTENVGFRAGQVIVSSVSAIDSISDAQWQDQQSQYGYQVMNALKNKFESGCCVILAYIYRSMSPFGSLSFRRGMCVPDKNLAIISGNFHGHKIAKYDVYRSTAHALGHLMGALNDDDGDVDCHEDEGNAFPYLNPFIMHATHQLNVGIRPNSMRMSFCSRMKIAVFLGSSFTNCLESNPVPYCGNGIVEPGEECDCGAPWQCVYNHQCCGMRDSFSPCKVIDIVPGEICSVPSVMDEPP